MGQHDVPELAFWGDTLARWPEKVVSKMGMGEEDGAYLVEIGLPVGVDWTIEISTPANEVRRAHDGLPILAFDGPMPICVDPNEGGIVIIREEGTTRLVNSDVRRFGAFLMLYQDYRMRVAELDDVEADELIDEIEDRMRTADAGAMETPEDYWSVIVEQMRDGFL